MAALPTERAFGVTNIKSHIPVILDMDYHNYDVWRELFTTHCLTFDVLGHNDGSSTQNGDNDTVWLRRDGLIKLWIYGTLTPALFRKAFKKGVNSPDIWLRIENFFRNNKEARAIKLDNELRTKEIGDMSVSEYFQSLKSIADLLANIDAPVPDRTLVMYLLNGVNDKFDYIINKIQHRQPFPRFEVAQNMLELEEALLKKYSKDTSSKSANSSSPTMLAATTQPGSNHSSQQQYKPNNNRG